MKYVYYFKEGNKDARDLLGGKGANLAEMANLNLCVPNGFTITTKACHKYYEDNGLSDEIKNEILEKLKGLETLTKKRFNDKSNPLLVSVRSGAPISMPGMMDTILNLGMTEEICEEMAKTNPRMAYDSYRRLIEMYSDVVMGYDTSKFSGYLNEFKKVRGYTSDIDLTIDELKELILKYKEHYLEIGGSYFPDDPYIQLINAIEAVFKSWNNERAITYRKVMGISDLIGTAVNVQEMVYGNKNEKSASGVLFSRNPATGENVLTGEFLLNAQGEDVVAGVRTPEPIEKLKEIMPDVYNGLYETAQKLEAHYGDVQDMEFTIDDGRLYILQTRTSKRTPIANVKFALDFKNEGKIDEKGVIKMVKDSDLEVLLKPTFDEKDLKNSKALTTGLPASPGGATGKLVFTSEKAKDSSSDDIILVREETSPEDIDGMLSAKGLLTKTGGLTSHAAIIARTFGVPTITGASEIEIDYNRKTLTIGDNTFNEGDYISIDGTTGNVYAGKLKLVAPNETKIMLNDILSIVKKYEKIQVRANADTKEEARLAMESGAKGIGLVRTEHMFFNEERILHMRKMILASTLKERKDELAILEKYQESDFEELIKEVSPYPVIVRYLDPPLHEFLPKENEIEDFSKESGIDEWVIRNKIKELSEVNPMMGFRGCRLAIKYNEICVMQTKALINAAIKSMKNGLKPNIEIMIPLTNDIREFKYVRAIVEKTITALFKAYNVKIPYKIGTMIETPRAALLSKEISKIADFYSFGTNDLTQLTYGLSRDDAGKFLNSYYDKNIYLSDPFKSVDELGVGALIKFAKSSASRKIEMGVCGEQGGDYNSIKFFTKIGLDYVSCSPNRVASARLSSAKVQIENE